MGSRGDTNGSRVGAGLCTFAALHFFAASAGAGQAVGHYFILDVSGSMAILGKDGKSRFEAAIDSLGSLLTGIDSRGEQAGVLLFSHRTGRCDDIEARVDITPKPRAGILRAISGLRPRGATPLSGSLDAAKEALARSRLPLKNVILLSDGFESCKGSPEDSARALREGDPAVRVHVVGIGAEKNLADKLRRIAMAGGGTYHGGNSAAQLMRALEDAMASRPEGPQDTEGAEAPILDPALIPSEVMFGLADQTEEPPPELKPKKQDERGPPLEPKKPEPAPKPSEAPKNRAPAAEKPDEPEMAPMPLL